MIGIGWMWSPVLSSPSYIYDNTSICVLLLICTSCTSSDCLKGNSSYPNYMLAAPSDLSSLRTHLRITSRDAAAFLTSQKDRRTRHKGAQNSNWQQEYNITICVVDDVRLQVMYQIVRDGALPPFCPRIVGRGVPWIRLSSSVQAPMNAPWFRVLLSKGARQENPTRHKSGTLDCKQRQSAERCHKQQSDANNIWCHCSDRRLLNSRHQTSWRGTWCFIFCDQFCNPEDYEVRGLQYGGATVKLPT